MVRLVVGEVSFHGLDEELDDLQAVIGLILDELPELLDAKVFNVVVWAVRRFGQICCL